jgi:hypothetical protein
MVNKTGEKGLEDAAGSRVRDRKGGSGKRGERGGDTGQRTEGENIACDVTALTKYYQEVEQFFETLSVFITLPIIDCLIV